MQLTKQKKFMQMETKSKGEAIKAKGEADFGMLVDMCNQIGWDKGIASLERIVAGNENAEVSLMENDKFKQAHKLRLQIIKQNMSISSKLIGDNQTDTICLETLAVKNMVRNHNLAQAISDVSWSEFVRMLEYKGKWYGKNVIKIDRFYASSKTCSNCGQIKDEINLSERTWDCSSCGANHDRDINAAINIKNSGMGSPGEPVELRPIGRAKKQEVLINANKHRSN